VFGRKYCDIMPAVSLSRVQAYVPEGYELEERLLLINVDATLYRLKYQCWRCVAQVRTVGYLRRVSDAIIFCIQSQKKKVLTTSIFLFLEKTRLFF
jgi:hypothetical protein